MTGRPETITDSDAWAKWREIEPLINRMIERVGTEGEFPVLAGSSLHGDDAAATPYQVSHVIRMCLTAGVDHLHAAKTLIVDNQVIHVAAPASLARGALETLATAYWILGPTKRDDRIARTLRWHVKNMRDADVAAAGLQLPGHRSLESTMAKLDTVAGRRGLNLQTLHRGYTSTEVVQYAESAASDLPLGVVLPWRICSGFAHGRPWAYLGVSDREVTDVGADDVVAIRLTSNLSKALYPSLAAMQLLERLLRLYQQRSGASLAGPSTVT